MYRRIAGRPGAILGGLAGVLAVLLAMGAGQLTVQAETTDIQVSQANQLVGAPVNVFVTFTVDSESDPIVSISRGEWTFTNRPTCVTGIGSSEALIDDEACPGTTPVRTAVLTTFCEKEGTVIVSSSAFAPGSPAETSFTCIKERQLDTRKAILRTDTHPGMPGGKSTLSHLGNLFVVETEARGLAPLTTFAVFLVDPDACASGSAIFPSDERGRLSAISLHNAETFLSVCGDEPALVSVVNTVTGQIVLTGALGK